MIWDILFKVWKKGSSFSGENEYISVSNSVIKMAKMKFAMVAI